MELELSRFGYGRYELRHKDGKIERDRGLTAGVAFVHGTWNEGELFLVTHEGETLLYRAWLDDTVPESSDQRQCATFVNRTFEQLCTIGVTAHPYEKMTAALAIQIAVANAEMFDQPAPATLEDVRAALTRMAASARFTWITGMAALDILDHVIDGKNLRDDCRIVPKASKCPTPF